MKYFKLWVLLVVLAVFFCGNRPAHSAYPLTAKDVTEGNVFEESDFDNLAAQVVNDAADVDNINDCSNDNTEYQTTKDPYSGDVETRPVSATEEIQTLRYAIEQMNKASQWYKYGEVTVISSTPFQLSQDITNYVVSHNVQVTINLQASAGLTDKVYYIKNKTGTIVTVDANGSETIDGATTIKLKTQYDHAILLCDGNQWHRLSTRSDPDLPRSYLAGAILSNDTDADHDINVTPGECRDSTDTENISITTNITKRIDATWAVGNDNGGLFTGSVANTTWYHVFAIKSTSLQTIDVGFDTSVTAANIPANYTYYRRLGSVLTDGSANILGFSQFGDEFLWDDPPQDLNDGTVTGTAELATLSTPLGVKTRAQIIGLYYGGSEEVLIWPIDQNDEDPDAVSPPGFVISTDSIAERMIIRTNTSSQVRYRADGSSGQIRINTFGWIDTRGRDD
jgi:hypothetical protein